MAGSSRPEAPHREPRRGQAEALGRLLEGVLANLDMGARLQEHLAVTAWPQVVGRVVAAHTRAQVVRDGVLVVATDSPAWAHELHLRKSDLLAKLSAQLGEGVIRDIHFRAGLTRQKPVRPGEESGRRPSPPAPASLRLSDEEIREAKEAAGRIEDAELRLKAERAFLSLARMSRWREETGWRRCARCGQWQRTGRRWCGSCLHGGQAGREQTTKG